MNATRKHRLIRLSVVLLALVLSVLVAGCSGGPASTEANPTDVDTSPASVTSAASVACELTVYFNGQTYIGGVPPEDGVEPQAGKVIGKADEVPCELESPNVAIGGMLDVLQVQGVAPEFAIWVEPAGYMVPSDD